MITAEAPTLNDTQWALSQILGALPQRRDWLDPDLEKMARGLVGMKKPAAPPVEEKDESFVSVQAVGDLLARIHGDGGHYQDEHGTTKAANAAEKKWLALREENANMRTAIQSAIASFEHIQNHESDFTAPEIFYWNALNQSRSAISALLPFTESK